MSKKKKKIGHHQLRNLKVRGIEIFPIQDIFIFKN